LKAFRSLLIAVLTAVLADGAASACATFGADQPAVDKVQQTWGSAEDDMKDGKYGEALKELRASETYLTAIRDVRTRNCVADGANVRIAAASAGEAYLSAHPGDFNGAKTAAHRAWQAYPIAHNCP
jgi:hypothetical protein